MPRRLVAVSLLALLGIVMTVALTIFSYARMRQAERGAAATLVSVRDAQRAFRSRPGHGGYATALASLVTPCPGDARAMLDPRQSVARDYTVVLRAAHDAKAIGADCHGRPMAADYYASAQPSSALDGRQAFAMTARARIYVFFDGIAPREADMGGGGLAVPLETVDRFKIP
jgi:hypothetical protein